MKIFISCFTILVLISNFFSITSSQSLFNLTTDQHSLIALKTSFITNPNSILLKNWTTQTPICQWIGISCSKKHHRVTALNISGFGLRGTIAPHLGNLTFLRSLDISSNNFTGTLPSELSNLRRLQDLNVAVNLFTGEIPLAFGALPELRHVYLYYNEFSGSIPGSLFNISSLEVLNMGYNFLSGKVPELHNLSRLETLSVKYNFLEGSIPNSIFNVSSLIAIDFNQNLYLSGKLPNNICSNTPKLFRISLGWNQLSGEIPKNIVKCRELRVLELQMNKFDGEIPSEIGSLSMLTNLYLWNNQFKGGLPEELSNLTSLEVMSLSNNSLSGNNIPPFIYNMSTLRKLDLSYNNFSGTLPSNMGLSLLNLQHLILHFNTLSGPIPTSLNNASNLSYLNLEFNSFSGPIPSFSNLRFLTMLVLISNHLTASEDLEFLSSLTNSQYLKVIAISNNPLNGTLPPSVGNLSQSLEGFYAVEAGVRGVIPPQIGNLINLTDIVLNDNELNGSIPRTLGNLKKVGRLRLSRNQLQGSIPINLCQMSSLADLDLSHNVLEGPIPKCLGEIQSLREIYFGENKLNSTISSNLWNLKDLVFLNLSSNYFSGEISSQVGKMKVINQIDFSSNQFSGHIPSSIDECDSLEYLSLSNNKFGGSIPQSLGSIKGLTTLDLSNNSLSGSIPESLQDLKFLEYLNVSYNRLEGEIPNEGVFANFTAQSFVHNSALCGATRFEVLPCLDASGRSRSKSVARLVLKYVLPPLLAGVIVVIIVVFLLRRRHRVKAPLPVHASIGVAWRVTSYIELSRATDSFNETNLLGRGSFGSVFKGILSDGLSIAVKVFNTDLEGAYKSFETESSILSTIRHRNLVRIIGCCTNMEFKGLILEFMPNGSLDKWLYSDRYCTDISVLLNISIDVAFALEYLHHGNTCPVVHCDVKPSNVLLDEDMTARVADFGISKLFNEGEAMVQTATLATVGYAAPEYGSEGKVSTSADVYSFGIMLLEMFTRKKPTDDMFDGEMSLKEWVTEAFEANAMNQVLVLGLLPEEDRHFAVKEKCVASVFELAMKCLADLPNERITMIEAVATLKKVKAKLETEVTQRHQQHAVTNNLR